MQRTSITFAQQPNIINSNKQITEGKGAFTCENFWKPSVLDGLCCSLAQRMATPMTHPSQRHWTCRNLSPANIPTINMPCRFRECVWETEQILSGAWPSFNIVNDEELLKPNWFYLHQRLLRHGCQSADGNYTFMSVTGGRRGLFIPRDLQVSFIYSSPLSLQKAMF